MRQYRQLADETHLAHLNVRWCLYLHRCEVDQSGDTGVHQDLRHLLRFPSAKAEGAKDLVYWSKERVHRRPVVFREGEPPLVTLFGMMRAADLPAPMRARTWIEPPLVIRSSDGAVHPEYAAVKLSVGFPP